MTSLFVAVLVLCFLSCYGVAPTCITDPPKEMEIDGRIDDQPEDIKLKIEEALKREEEVSLSVKSLAAEREFKHPEEKYYPIYTDTCPRVLKFITIVDLYVGSGEREKCFVVFPFQQRVTSAHCKGEGCFGNFKYWSQCVRTGWTRFRFWVWCPTCGFKLIARWYPQQCSCFWWYSCHQLGHV